MQSTSVSVDGATHRELEKLAAALGVTIADAVTLAVRRLRQDQIGNDLRSEPTQAETAWLDADLR